MSEKIKEMAKKYYPKYWNVKRMNALLENGKLTAEEYREVMYGERATSKTEESK